MARMIATISGGVDSAVAAARAQDAGHEVVGVHLNLASATTQGLGCFSPDAEQDAQAVADHLGIDFEVWDLTEEFDRDVVDHFVGQYAAGRTPNPCLRCNEKVKFSAVCDTALARGFDAVITGHYARLVTGDDGHVELHRGSDSTKDQSYVLGVLTQDRLRHCLFPLGESNKNDVRQEARTRGIRVADKRDSFDICFIPDGDTAGFLRQRLGSRPGDIRDELGGVVGQHEGSYAYTIGQRKGLKLGNPRSDGRPRYVTGVDSETNTVHVGPRENLAISSVRVVHPLWCDQGPDEPFHAGVQLRAHGREIPALVTPDGDAVRIDLERPEYGVAPGQSAVIYNGTQVIGSTVIDSTS